MLVHVHPRSSFSYYGFYLSGLEAIGGHLRLRFSSDMPPLADAKDGIALELEDGRRLFVAANDWSRVDSAALDWCDVLGIVNYDPNEVPAGSEKKVRPIGPGFGVRWHGSLNLLNFVARSAFTDRQGRRAVSRLRAYSRHQRSREPLTSYVTQPSDPTYVFFAATYWDRHPEANTFRTTYIRTMREYASSRGITFEGGFASSSHSVHPVLLAENNYGHRDYLTRVQRSAVAFNTPAVHQCLGWKLGEYFALGKAIISTPLTRIMPEPLEHGRNVHFVDGSSESIGYAVDLLTRDHDYRHHLETGARSYWERWLTPHRVMQTLLHASSASPGPSSE